MADEQNMQQNDINTNTNSRYAGNRLTLRRRMLDTTWPVPVISNAIGPLSDSLTISVLSITVAMVLGLFGTFVLCFLVYNGHSDTLLQDIPAYLMIIAGGLIITGLLLLNNPSKGNQLILNLKNLKARFNRLQGKGVSDERLNGFLLNKFDSSIAVYKDARVPYYIAAYRVRGLISKVSFDQELLSINQSYRNLLINMDRDTILTTVNSIQKARLNPMPLPKNATPAMVAKRDKLYRITQAIPNNQQLNTTLYVIARSEQTLNTKVSRLNNILPTLTAGAVRLSGDDLRKEIRKIYV